MPIRAGREAFPNNQYNLAENYGPTAYDVRNRVFIGGTVAMPHGFRLNPFLVVTSGIPFNITLGQDYNGDSIFNDRPTFATPGQIGAEHRSDQVGNVQPDATAGADGDSSLLRYGAGTVFAEPAGEQDHRLWAGDEERRREMDGPVADRVVVGMVAAAADGFGGAIGRGR